MKPNNTQTNLKSGSLLVAEPFMNDPYFKRAVVLLTEHRKDGSVGFILNKQLDVRISDLLGDFPAFDSAAYYGGPVQTDTIHYVHNVGDLLEDSVKVGKGVYWGGDFEKLKFLIDSKLITEKNIRFYVGYTGWTEGQLEEEIKDGAWMIADLDANYVFQQKLDTMWKMVLENKGSSYAVIGQMIEYNIEN